MDAVHPAVKGYPGGRNYNGRKNSTGERMVYAIEHTVDMVTIDFASFITLQ